jgi:outer membrane murein-binding lipoprotein Lpp
LKEELDTKSKTLTVAFNVAELSLPRTWKSGSANEAKPLAASSCVDVQTLNWAIKRLAPDDEFPGPGGF